MSVISQCWSRADHHWCQNPKPPKCPFRLNSGPTRLLSGFTTGLSANFCGRLHLKMYQVIMNSTVQIHPACLEYGQYVQLPHESLLQKQNTLCLANTSIVPCAKNGLHINSKRVLEFFQITRLPHHIYTLKLTFSSLIAQNIIFIPP